jgi:hypothetical protein
VKPSGPFGQLRGAEAEAEAWQFRRKERFWNRQNPTVSPKDPPHSRQQISLPRLVCSLLHRLGIDADECTSGISGLPEGVAGCQEGSGDAGKEGQDGAKQSKVNQWREYFTQQGLSAADIPLALAAHEVR